MFSTFGLAFVGRSLCFLFACFFFYIAVFLSEDEEGALQNRLEELWIVIDDRSKQTSAIGAFLTEISRVTDELLEGLFGKRIFSARAVAVVTSLSFASSMGVLAALDRANGIALVLAAVSLVLGIAAANRRAIIYAFIPAGCVVFVAGMGTLVGVLDSDSPYNSNSGPQAIATILPAVAVIGGACSDFVFIALTRRFLQCAKRSSALALLGLSGIASFVALQILPWLSQTNRVTFQSDSIGSPHDLLVILMLATTSSNFFSVIATSAVFFVLIAGLLHPLLWVLLRRPIYALQRFRLVTNRGLLGSLGLTCLGVAFPWLKFIREFLK
jgi:hypothetical protein